MTKTTKNEGKIFEIRFFYEISSPKLTQHLCSDYRLAEILILFLDQKYILSYT